MIKFILGTSAFSIVAYHLGMALISAAFFGILVIAIAILIQKYAMR